MIKSRVITIFFVLICSLSVNGGYQHPLGVRVVKDIDLPLEQGKVTCITCHDKHIVGKTPKIKSQLRKKINELCVTCHLEKTQSKNTHMDLVVKTNKSASCFKCHKIHITNRFLLNMDSGKFCTKCHSNKKNDKHKKIDLDLPDSILGEVKLDEKGQITCVTCHVAHVSNRKKSFLRPLEKFKNYCSSCHGIYYKTIFSKMHH